MAREKQYMNKMMDIYDAISVEDEVNVRACSKIAMMSSLQLL